MIIMIKRYAHLFLYLLPLSFASYANQIPNESRYDKEIEHLYQQLPPKLSTDKKLDTISRRFMGKPYVLGPLGEGALGKYDQDPLYRTDAYDCLTYVDTMMALTYAKNLDEFKKINLQLRYANGQPDFIERNHFMSADWNKHNAEKAFVQDITHHIRDVNNQPVAKTMKTEIDKPGWYQRHQLSSLKLKNSKNQEKALESLRNESKKMKKETVSIPYIPLTTLFDKKGKANHALFQQIPNASVIEIVRKKWPNKKVAGTEIGISHLGLGMKENNQIMFRHASSIDKKVVNLPLQTYLRKYLKSPTVIGINIQKIKF